MFYNTTVASPNGKGEVQQNRFSLISFLLNRCISVFLKYHFVGQSKNFNIKGLKEMMIKIPGDDSNKYFMKQQQGVFSGEEKPNCTW